MAKQITLDAEMILETTIGARSDGRTFQAILADFPPNTIEKFLRYGFQRVFNDRVGRSDTDLATKIENAEAMIEAYKRGEIGRQVAAGVDAVTKLARSKLRAALKATRKDTPEWAAFMDKSPQDQAAKLDEILALPGNETFRAEAEKEIAARAKAVTRVNTEGVTL